MRILICIFLLLQFEGYSQLSYSFEVIPKIVFANYKGDGIIPAGFNLQKRNPCLSLGFTITKKIHNRIYLNLGTYYHINTYYSKYYRDFNSDTKDPFNSSSISSSYFEPKLTITFNEFSILKLKNLYFETGISYLYTQFPDIIYNIKINGENIYGVQDTVKFTTNMSPINNSRFKLLVGFGKNFDLGKSNFILGIGLNAKLSQDEQIIIKEVVDNGKYYKFDYKINSSYIGINIRLTYENKKKTNSIN